MTFTSRKIIVKLTQEYIQERLGVFCTIYFCLVSRILIASFQNGEIEKARDSQKDGKMALLTLNEIINLLSNLSEDTNIPVRKLEKPGKSKLPARRKRYSLSFCNCFQTSKFPHLLSSKKYHIIPVYCHLLLSMIQSPSSPFSPSSLILPTRLSQSFEPYRTYYTSTIPRHPFF